jgi:hypothetical protein
MTERLDITDIVGDLDLACEARRHPTNNTDPATWVVWVVQCCTARPPVGLACDDCLRRWLTANRPARCADCGHRDLPRRWVLAFERINKPPATT